ncbi:MAG: cobalt transporter CbiM [Bacillota bacterium]|nr:cobalt transporter CbiM [Bacillota bacterium]
MHIPDGILPVAVSAGGYAIAGLATWHSLSKINQKDDPRKEIPKASLLTAAFFVASWIQIPIPPASVHLTLIGLLGAMLGFYAFPAILIGLFFQAVMFQQGGLTTLGVNATIMGIPALLSFYLFNLFRGVFLKGNSFKTGFLGFSVGITGVGIAVIMFYLIVVNFIPADINIVTERAAVFTLTSAHLPLVLLEGLFTASLLMYLNRVKPEMLEA